MKVRGRFWGRLPRGGVLRGIFNEKCDASGPVGNADLAQHRVGGCAPDGSWAVPPSRHRSFGQKLELLGLQVVCLTRLSSTLLSTDLELISGIVRHNDCVECYRNSEGMS